MQCIVKYCLPAFDLIKPLAETVSSNGHCINITPWVHPMRHTNDHWFKDEADLHRSKG